MNPVSAPCPFAPGTALVVYLRHSPGEDQTITSQESAVRAWFDRHGLALVDVFRDEARSGTSTAGRDQFLLMFDALRQGQILPRPAGVVLWSFSRFAREMQDAEYYKWSLRHWGYHVHSMTDGIPEGDLAPVFESFVHWKDAERSREISRDSQRGLQWLAEQGYSTGGYPPIGYKKSAPIEIGRKKNGAPRLAHKWEKDPETEARVARAWAMKVEGRSDWDIHKATGLCASTRGYSTLFKCVTYTGARKCGAVVIEGAHPAYVSREDFDRVQARRQPTLARVRRGDSVDHPARRPSPYLMSGVLRCGYCGWAMSGLGTHAYARYCCDWRHRAGKPVCPQPTIVAHVVHDAVCEWIATEIATYERLALNQAAFAAALSGSGDALRERQRDLADQRDRLAKQIGHLVTAIERGGWSEAVQERLDGRRREHCQIEAELKGIRTR